MGRLEAHFQTSLPYGMIGTYSIFKISKLKDTEDQ